MASVCAKQRREASSALPVAAEHAVEHCAERDPAMTRIAILGATGYTALELIKILLRHPQAEIVAVTSRQEGQPHIAMIHPSLTGRLDLRLEDLEPGRGGRPGRVRVQLPAARGQRGRDSAICWTPVPRGRLSAPTTASTTPRSTPSGTAQKHPDPERLGKVVYGLPELFREQIPPAPLVANPGCYPTSAILALAPLLKAGLIEPQPIIVDSKSGVSGRRPHAQADHPLSRVQREHFGLQRRPAPPHARDRADPQHRGRHEGGGHLHAAPGAHGPRHPQHHLLPAPTAESARKRCCKRSAISTPTSLLCAWSTICRARRTRPDTNFCDITARVVRGRVLTISCLDNLIKGASGAAVQNFNLMYGYPETTALGRRHRPMADPRSQGYLLAGVHCRIKRDPQKQDLTLVMSETPARAAGVYTQNLVYAAPVALDRSRTPSDRIRAVVINSGNANACTGERGLRDAERDGRPGRRGLRGRAGPGPGALHRRDRRVSAHGQDRTGDLRRRR